MTSVEVVTHVEEAVRLYEARLGGDTTRSIRNAMIEVYRGVEPMMRTTVTWDEIGVLLGMALQGRRL